MPTLYDLCRISERALKIRDLTGIATCSRSPSNAWKIAKRMGWQSTDCQSASALAIIYFEYGQKAYENIIEELAPETWKSLCLCECHHGLKRNDAYCDCCTQYANICFCNCHHCSDCLEHNNECEQKECSCDCHNSDCCDDCATFCFCQCHSCNGFNDWCDDCAHAHETEEEEECEEDYSSDNEYIEYEDEETDDDDEEEEENDDEYEEGDENEYEEQEKHEELVPVSKLPIPAPSTRTPARIPPNFSQLSPDSKAIQHSDRIQRVAGTNYPIYRYAECGVNGAASGDAIAVTKKAESELDDDELAFVLGHEVAHNALGHIERRKERYENLFDQTKETVKESFNQGRYFSGVIKGLVVGGLGFVANRAIDQYEEHDADAASVALMKQAGYDPKGATKFLEKSPDNSPSFTGTHPPNRQRKKHIEKAMGYIEKR